MTSFFHRLSPGLVWFGAAVSLLGCGGAPQQADTAQEQSAITFKPGVTVLGGSAALSRSSRHLALQGTATSLKGVTAGKPFVVGNRAYLAKQVQDTADGLDVETTEPAFDDVIQEVHLHGEQVLQPSDIIASSLAPSVELDGASDAGPSARSLESTSSSSPLKFSFNDLTIVDLDGNSSTTYDRIVASGTVALDIPTLHFDVDLDGSEPPTVKLDFTAGEAIDLSVGTPSIGFDKSYTVPIATFQVDVPYTLGLVALAGSINLVFDANGQIRAFITFSQTGKLAAGFVGEGNPWKVTPYSKSTSTFTVGAPTVTGSLGLGAYVSPRISLLILQYDTAGIYAKLGVYANANATVSTAQQCIDVDIDGKLGINGYFQIPIWKIDAPLYAQTWPIYENTFCNP